MANTSIAAEIIAKAREHAKSTGLIFDVALAEILGCLLFDIDNVLHYFESNVPEDPMSSLEFQDTYLEYVEEFLDRDEFEF